MSRSTAALFLVLTLSVSLSACSVRPAPDTSPPSPPVAERRPRTLEGPGEPRVDDYYWLRDREDAEVIAYLEAENDYAERASAAFADLREEIFVEMRDRVDPDDASVPVARDGVYAWVRYRGDADYPEYVRQVGSLEAPVEVMLDANRLAEGQSFLSVRSVSTSDDHRLLAYAVDTVGRRFYSLRFRDLETGEELPDVLERTTGGLAWAADGSVLYERQDPETLRSHRIWRHVLGTDPSADTLVWEESDEAFSVHVWRTRSRRFLVIGSLQTLASEMRVLEASRPSEEPRLLVPRRRGHEYSVDHLGDNFYYRSNAGGPNFRLMRSSVADTREEAWTEVVPHRDDVLLEGFELFERHLVLEERRDGLVRLRVRRWDDGAEHEIAFEDPVWTASIGANPEVESSTLRYEYSSLVTPDSVIDVDLETGESVVRKRDRVLGGFRAEDYVAERTWATSRDGVRVPISLVRRRDVAVDGRAPLVLHGYGAYGISTEPSFRSGILSLLDRGFVYALAHVRGGEELGRRWYEGGRLAEKENSFHDFLACAEHLIAGGWADPGRVYARGGSAGGLLVGAAINLRPDLFHGAVAHVPFVDVLTTMLDEDLPLTTVEYDEWGDPNDPEVYRRILGYSPYDNVEARDYPHLLVTTGLWDSQVQYWEPAKWVAKLRALKTDDHLLLLRTEMDAGHGGISGRYRRLRDQAFEAAFLVHLAGSDS